jgi:menaquinol-cytochrome c reductase iron-sulfur subunit
LNQVAESQGNDAQNGASSRQYAGPRAIDPVVEPTHEDDPDFITRTKFLSSVAIAGGVVLTAAILVPLVGFAVSDSVKKPPEQWVDVGPVSSFPDGQTTSIAVSGLSQWSDARVFLRNKGGQMIAIWNRCAHLGCPVEYLKGGDNYVCPCHGGAYDSLGIVTAGPPPRPLDRFEVKVVDSSGKPVGGPGTVHGSWSTAAVGPADRLLVGSAFSINSEQQPYSLHDPGEPVTGTLSHLYPFS